MSGGFALVGALAGVLLTTYLGRSSKRAEARRSRVEDALRRVSAVIAASNFATHIGATNPPSGVTARDVQSLESRLFIRNLENYYQALHDARHSVAMLALSGVDVGDSWRTAEQFQADLEAIYERLHHLLVSA